ncbi:hypothetical protein [Bifidobacterium aesculapii]|uniref:hypothetical protein n=1 Tax=Bifidobacterium aesculapii TaxID=1329411 RepID=UPI0006E1D4A7|nr:hypothetical protein [Bifidobacterium aesculapii]
MSTVDIVITVAVCVVGVPLGMFFGFIPMRTSNLSEEQNRLSQTLGVIGVGLIIVLIFTKQDAASWAATFAMIAGVLIAKIPPLHRWALRRFPVLRPARDDSDGKSGKGGRKRK